MSILKWLREIGSCITAARDSAPAVLHFSPLGNAIDPEWRSGWSPDDSDFYETRRLVGHSAEGFHAGVEMSHRVCDRIVWGEAHATPEKARDAAGEMEKGNRRLPGN